MLEGNTSPAIPASSPAAIFERQQRRRMLAALCILLVALILVLVKDRQFLFPPAPVSEAVTFENKTPTTSASPITPKLTAPAVSQKPSAPPAPVRQKPTHTAAAAAQEASAPQATTPPLLTATNRAVLPPLEVEVVAGNQRRAVSPGDTSVNVELQSGTAPLRSNAATNAAARVQLSPDTAQMVSRSVEPTYPLLAKQMKVQGAVVLQALIGKNGNIEDVQVLSGPAILSAAAREAVKQWRFKPYLQGGRPVETEARITVNFTISTY
jgi:protein TonB